MCPSRRCIVVWLRDLVHKPYRICSLVDRSVLPLTTLHRRTIITGNTLRDRSYPFTVMAQRGNNIELAPTALEDQKVMDVNTETIEAVSGDTNKAAQLLKEAGHSIVITSEENKRILRKIDLAILPIILVIYCMQFLDKAALSYASVFGLIKDTHLVGSEYSWLGSVVYVAQLVWQPVVAYMLVRFPIGKFCTAMVFCWGVTLCGMAAAHNFGGLMATRFLLGSFEASVAPINIALVQMVRRARLPIHFSHADVLSSGTVVRSRRIATPCGTLRLVSSTSYVVHFPSPPTAMKHY